MSEFEQETRKLFIATHADPMPQILPELLRSTERAALG